MLPERIRYEMEIWLIKTSSKKACMGSCWIAFDQSKSISYIYLTYVRPQLISIRVVPNNRDDLIGI